MTLSSANLKWSELISIINKLNKQGLSEEDIRNLAYHQRCQLLIVIQSLLQDTSSTG